MSAPLVRTSTPGIYKRGKRYVVKERDQTGRIKTQSCATLSEAKDVKAQIRTDSARGEFRTQTKLAFDVYALEWIETYTGRTSRGFKESTRNDYRSALKNHVIPFFQKSKLSDIEPRDVKRFLAHMAKKQVGPAHGRRPISRDAIRNAFAPLKCLFSTAVEDGLIRHSPATSIRIPAVEVIEDDDAPCKALTKAQVESLLTSIPPKWRLFVMLLACTGLRIGEAVALRWSDVDLTNATIRVRRTLYKGAVTPPKSRYGKRTIPLPPQLVELLIDLRRNGAAGADASSPVFPSRTGTMLYAGNILVRIFKPAAERAGTPWATFHTLRHTYGSHLFREGLNVKQVQRLLGHHSAAFTLEKYIHEFPEDLPDVRFIGELIELEFVPAAGIPIVQPLLEDVDLESTRPRRRSDITDELLLAI